MDVKKQINTAIETGKVILGANKAIDSILYAKPKLILLAGNCPRSQKETISYYASLANVKCAQLKETSTELGSACGRPHHLSALTILDEGDSTILGV
ncbi:MAG: 50S ribosomal protein L30e [Candidatus Altiarchaeota archaeon]